MLTLPAINIIKKAGYNIVYDDVGYDENVTLLCRWQYLSLYHSFSFEWLSLRSLALFSPSHSRLSLLFSV